MSDAVLNDISTALYACLTGSTALTTLLASAASVYDTQAPDGATYDYVAFSHTGGGPTNQTPRDDQNNLFFVRAYSHTSAKKAGQIDAQLYSLLHHKPLTVSGWSNFWMARETDLKMIENEPSGGKIWMQGGYYRIRLDRD